MHLLDQKSNDQSRLYTLVILGKRRTMLNMKMAQTSFLWPHRPWLRGIMLFNQQHLAQPGVNLNSLLEIQSTAGLLSGREQHLIRRCLRRLC